MSQPPNPPAFPPLDSNQPEFWDVRYTADFMPWDFGGVPQRLIEFVAQQSSSTRPTQPRVLVPGCGSGYEARFLAEHGFDVSAIDFSASALEIARRHLGPWQHILEQADFFTFGAPACFDLVFERTFLCALKPNLRSAYAERMAVLLKPGALLAGFFYYDDKSGGPPFAMRPAELEDLLGAHFLRLQTLPVADSIPIFAGKERWEVWQRRSGD